MALTVPALAHPHRDARDRLDRVQICRARDRPIELRRGQLLAPTHDRLLGGEFVDPRADGMKGPERPSKSLFARKALANGCGAARRLAGGQRTEVEGRTERREPTLL